MATINNARELSSCIVNEIGYNFIDRIIVFGSLAVKGDGNDIDLIVIMKNRSDSSGRTFYDEIQRKIVTPFIKRQLVGVDLFVWDVNKVIKHNSKGSPFLKLVQKEGLVLYMSENYLEEWFKFAKEDYEMANILFKNAYYRGSCIHSQQAIEKCLKGMLVKNKWELERTHNIGALIAFAHKYNIPIQISDEDIELIDSIYRGRYPAEEGLLPFGEPGKEEAEKSLGIAKNILSQSGIKFKL